MWNKVSKELPSGTVGHWTALDIWINKPHVLNRNLCGSCLLLREEITCAWTTDEIIEAMKNNYRNFFNTEELSHSLKTVLTGHGQRVPANLPMTFEICIRDIHPKQLDRYSPQREAIVIDRLSGTASFVPLLILHEDGTSESDEGLLYRIYLNESSKSVSLHVVESPVVEKLRASGAACTKEWLHSQLLTKIARWSCHENLEAEVKSLRLVPLDRYNQRYHDMKSKYGPHLVKNWPESTDPQKFVYEDIAIAAYLLTLWDHERESKNLTEKQTFVDLGCGNGLLVHLLANEGYRGKGVDLRKRNIWDFYGPETYLEEYSFTPSDSNLFCGYDWLIGNHSDELTPWIPVIAARSSFTCSYFVLPCCAFDFDSKFKQKQHGKSQYRCYLDYIKHVGKECGFTVEEDTLRIPSTKRVCFIGKSRTYKTEDEATVEARRCDLISSHCSIQGLSSPPGFEDEHSSLRGENWIDSFQARNQVEIPRNCLTVDKAVVRNVVDVVFREVLERDSETSLQTEDGRKWRTGGKIALPDVVKLFESDVLKELKNECGGLQTLLRNHYHIFRVQAGVVGIRDMGEADNEHWKRKQKQRGTKKLAADMRKTRLCYLHSHHPDGCPRTSEGCRFAHGEEELRTL